MSLMTAARLFGAMLVEMVSGNYGEGERFLQAAAELRRKRITGLFSTIQKVFRLVPALKAGGIRVPADMPVLMCSSLSTVRGFSKPMNILILDFVQLGRMAFHTLEGYCSNQVSLKIHLLDPVIEADGTVTRSLFGSGKSGRNWV